MTGVGIGPIPKGANMQTTDFSSLTTQQKNELIRLAWKRTLELRELVEKTPPSVARETASFALTDFWLAYQSAVNQAPQKLVAGQKTVVQDLPRK